MDHLDYIALLLALHAIGKRLALEDLFGDPPRYSTVPTTTDILVPETLVKKQTADAQATAATAAKQLALKKASIISLFTTRHSISFSRNVVFL